MDNEVGIMELLVCYDMQSITQYDIERVTHIQYQFISFQFCPIPHNPPTMMLAIYTGYTLFNCPQI